MGSDDEMHKNTYNHFESQTLIFHLLNNYIINGLKGAQTTFNNNY
jgi:hypothetical protein